MDTYTPAARTGVPWPPCPPRRDLYVVDIAVIISESKTLLRLLQNVLSLLLHVFCKDNSLRCGSEPLIVASFIGVAA